MAFVAPISSVLRTSSTSSTCVSRSGFAQFSGMKKVNGEARLQVAAQGSAFGGAGDANDAFYNATSTANVSTSTATSMKLKVAINGFGRIGRNVLRCWATRPDSGMDIVVINDTSGVKTAAHLLKYDSILGTFEKDVTAGEDELVVDGKSIKIVSNRDPLQLPWKEMGIDIVIEGTGVFVTKEGAGKHIQAGAKKVLITAPGKGDGIGTFVIGVNSDEYDHDKFDIVSNASCTTNCMAPFMKVLDDAFGVTRGMMTTTHSYTGDQRLLDAGHRDLRRARSAALNIVPTTTGAAKAVALVVPSLAGKLNGIALRVPTPNVSVCDVVMQVGKSTFKEEVNGALLKASMGSMKGVIKYCDEQLVSGDFRGTDESCIIDSSLTMCMGDDLVKVVAWYDNEWGYSQRVVDLGELMAAKWK